MEEIADLVRRSLSPPTRTEFERRIEEQATYVIDEFGTGQLDNADAAIGLEIELYAIGDEDQLATLPPDYFETAPVNPELGRHNAEINTAPTVLGAAGIADQADAVKTQLHRARHRAEAEGRHLVLDGMWTIPPKDGSLTYLSDTTEVDGIKIASNMHRSPRYHALDNAILSTAGGHIPLDVPGARLEFPTILVESLTSSMQPHLQIPDVKAFPPHFNTAIRTLGPILAISTNSPFLPADLYQEPADRVLEDTNHELRIPVFEQSINANDKPGKVRVPRDIEQVEDIVNRLVDDRTVAPFLNEWVSPEDEDRYAEAFWELDHKHGTYWRWVRPVIGGDYIDKRNTRQSLRIEYRPLPTQPSIPDIIGLQCLVAGLIRGLVDADHPLPALDWADAKASFYNAAADGLDANLQWMTIDGTPTTESDQIFQEVFRFARQGLLDAGVPGTRVETLLDPIERRWQTQITPSTWKVDRVTELVADGTPLADAVREMQSDYNQQSQTGDPLVDWP